MSRTPWIYVRPLTVLFMVAWVPFILEPRGGLETTRSLLFVEFVLVAALLGVHGILRGVELLRQWRSHHAPPPIVWPKAAGAPCSSPANHNLSARALRTGRGRCRWCKRTVNDLLGLVPT